VPDPRPTPRPGPGLRIRRYGPRGGVTRGDGARPGGRTWRPGLRTDGWGTAPFTASIVATRGGTCLALTAPARSRERAIRKR